METEFKPNYAIHPGIFLKEDLLMLKISQSKLSELTGIPKTVINEIIKGKRSINAKISILLDEIIGFEPNGFWLKLQTAYDELVARLEFEREKKSVIIKQERNTYKLNEKYEMNTVNIEFNHINRIVLNYSKDLLFAA